MALPTRTLGKTGAEVSILGLGGEGVLRTYGRDREATELIRRALDLGVTYFESARAYAGSEEYLGRALGRDRDRVFLATKSHHRSARGARAHLDESLALLRTDWIDLWFVHDVRTRKDLDLLAGPGGALQTFAKARGAGEVRFVGVSGHENPEVLRDALDLFDFDCVLLPVNPAEAEAGPFAETVLPAARGKNLGVIAMKTLCRGLTTRVPGYPGPGPFLRYALATAGVTLASVGCDDPLQLEENARAAEAFTPLPPSEREDLEQLLYPYQRDLLYYRGTLSSG
ncbi:MAG: aldo/keto reductase [Deferrisomatales bacterium]|nr:aldo/keto reductase [Deferrisomatales bacterium]